MFLRFGRFMLATIEFFDGMHAYQSQFQEVFTAHLITLFFIEWFLVIAL